MVESDSGSPPDQAAERAKAVAVKRAQEDALPRITATGRGKLAEQILSIAFETDVKVRQDKELVDILDTYELDSPVPIEALGAVSESCATSMPPTINWHRLVKTPTKTRPMKTRRMTMPICPMTRIRGTDHRGSC